MKIRQKFTSVAHPQTNGQVEVTNRTIVNGIKTRLDRVGGGWVDERDSVLWAYRTSLREGIGESPFNLVYGSEAIKPAEIGMETHKIPKYDKNQNLGLLRKNLDMTSELKENAYVRLEKYISWIRASYNRKVRNRIFCEGDLVLRRADALKSTGKLEPNWEGPYRVVKVLLGGAYELKDITGKKFLRP